ncbi:MAG: MerR family transcriptional regulator [Bradymonadaceae bacterium]
MNDLELPELTSFELPDKTFKIGEVAKLLGLETHTLRYWEEQFEMLDPPKTDTGQRTYRRSDIEVLSAIQRLLHEEKFNTEGARRQLRLARAGEPCYLRDVMGEGPEEFDEDGRIQKLREARDRLRERVDELESTAEQARQERDEAIDRRDQLVEERDEAREQYRTAVDERDALAERVRELEEALESARAAEDEESEAVEKWRNAARRLQNEVESLEDDLEEARSTNERLARERDRAADQGAAEQEVVDALQREIQQLQQLARSK